MNEEILSKVFVPNLITDRNGILLSENNLAYYTSAGTLYSLLKNKKLWLRSTMCMNDYQEIRYAANCVRRFMVENNLSMLNSFVKAISQIISLSENELRVNLEHILDDIVGGLYLHTYIMCFTEHDDKEFPDGNLQMFNSYGRCNGVCIIFDRDKLINLELPIYKVRYFGEEKIKRELNDLIDRIEDNSCDLHNIASEKLLNYLYLFFINIIVTTKHPGFKQEKEWRLVVNDRLLRYSDGFKNSLREEVECISGVPQIIKKIDIKGYGNVLRKIILEPRYDMTAEALAISKLLKDELHIEKPLEIVRISDIPIRR